MGCVWGGAGSPGAYRSGCGEKRGAVAVLTPCGSTALADRCTDTEMEDQQGCASPRFMFLILHNSHFSSNTTTETVTTHFLLCNTIPAF